MKTKHLFLLALLLGLTIEDWPNFKKILYSNSQGQMNGYNYELWKDTGNTRMGLCRGGTFDCWWEKINNVLFHIGKKWDCTKYSNQLWTVKVQYGAYYKLEGNSYLCVYGWTKDPLVEYYIVDSWGSWRTPGGSSKSVIFVDGGRYDVYVTTRYNQPSIIGTKSSNNFWVFDNQRKKKVLLLLFEHFK